MDWNREREKVVALVVVSIFVACKLVKLTFDPNNSFFVLVNMCVGWGLEAREIITISPFFLSQTSTQYIHLEEH